MFFRIELLNKFNQGRFAESWLAATCPTLFRRNYRKNHVVKISVTKICKDIQEMWNTNSNQVKDRLSLFLAAQLFYGTVCIHQQQVHFLYEATLELYCLENLLTKLVRDNTETEKNIGTKNHRAKYIKKCRNHQVANSFVMEDYGLVVCQSQNVVLAQAALEKSVEELLQEPDFVCVPNASITLIEDPITTSPHDMLIEIQEEEQQMFDGPEYCEFMNFNENVHPAKRAKLQETSSLVLDIPLGQQSKNQCYSNLNLAESSLDIIARVNHSANPLATTNSFDNFYQQINTGSTPLRDNNQRDPLLNYFDSQSKQLISIIAENRAEPTIEPIIQQSIREKTPDVSPPKTTKRRRVCKKRLIIDSAIEITDKGFFNQIQDYTSTLRVLHPTNDVVSLWKLELMRNIFQIAGHKILSIPLNDEYKSRLVTKPMPVDTDIFAGVLNMSEIMEPREKNNKRSKKRKHDEQPVKIIERPIAIPFEPEVHPPPITISIDNPLPMETTEIPSLFPENLTGLTSSMLKEQFGKREIYGYLKILWENNVHPIGMRTLCAGLKQRKYIAMVFFSLMCLQADGSIKLISNLNDREIYDIQPVN